METGGKAARRGGAGLLLLVAFAASTAVLLVSPAAGGRRAVPVLPRPAPPADPPGPFEFNRPETLPPIDLMDVDVAAGLAGADLGNVIPAPVVDRDGRDHVEPDTPDHVHTCRERPDLTVVTGSPDCEKSVDLALLWLRNHQELDGRWDSDGFERQCVLKRCGGAGVAGYDVAATGLALLAFLGAGNTHKDGEFRETVQAGLQFLRSVQDEEGCFAARTDPQFVLQHSIATLAVCEAYALTRSPLLKAYARSGIDFAIASRNPRLAWGREVRSEENDTIVSGWMTMALASGRSAGFAVDPEAFAGMRTWLDQATDRRTGRAGVFSWTDGDDAATAVAVFARTLLGETGEDGSVRRGAERCLEARPAWDPARTELDLHSWFFGTVALFRVGGEPWDEWNKAMGEAIVESQIREKTDDRRGSWEPIGRSSWSGGRVVSTALLAMCLEVYYRYDKVFGAREL